MTSPVIACGTKRSASARTSARSAAAPGLATLPPPVDPEVQKAVTDALLLDRQIDALYAPGPSGDPRGYRLQPLGLILRGGVTDLVACQGGATSPALYALHRFRRADVRPDPVSLPGGFDLDAALRRGRGQFGIPAQGATSLKLVMDCDAVLAALLAESPLADDQQARALDDVRVEIRATVADSWELRWWLLGRGSQLDVLAPVALRREIATQLQRAAAQYPDR